jgi:hypothetical protein
VKQPSSQAYTEAMVPLIAVYRRCLARTTLIRVVLLGFLAAFLCSASPIDAEAAETCSPVPSQSASTPRDGSHDFDFNFGVWHTHIRRILDPFDSSSQSMELDGTVTVRKIWKGKAQLEEIEADGPKGHWEGATLFLYNPEAHQWSQTFVDSKAGVVNSPTIGSFKNGRGELLSQDTFQNKTILVKGVWSDITPDAHRYEELYSNDGGGTWHSAFIAQLTRSEKSCANPAPEADEAPQWTATDGPQDQSHAFDWDLGTWQIHMSRLSHPLTGSTTWTQMDGITINSKVWGGRSNLAEVEADGPTGHLELLAWRLYNPASHEWTTSFATSDVGALNAPTGQAIVGEFKKGRGEFYDQEPYHGRSILVRFRIGPTSKDSAESEQAFSDDGGKTWETNWVNNYTRTH